MKKPKLTKAQEKKQLEDYIKFLEKRLASKNYKNRVSGTEYAKTQEQYSKAKFRLKMWR